MRLDELGAAAPSAGGDLAWEKALLWRGTQAAVQAKVQAVGGRASVVARAVAYLLVSPARWRARQGPRARWAVSGVVLARRTESLKGVA
jgi:hypothetical protein